MSLMTRVVEAVGSAIVYMGVFAVVLATFPNSVASTYVIEPEIYFHISKLKHIMYCMAL